jgi:hypothetical protein
VKPLMRSTLDMALRRTANASARGAPTPTGCARHHQHTEWGHTTARLQGREGGEVSTEAQRRTDALLAQSIRSPL